MLRHSFISKRIFALLLPLALLWSWAGCVSVCAEITERHIHAGAIEEHEQHVFGANEKAENCAMTIAAAVLQERQSVKASALAAANPPALPLRASHRAWASRLPEIKQNSPPKLSIPPLFVRLCAFRI